jgi:putative ABC transport system permease protein
MESLIQDIRYGLRSLVKSRAFTIVAVIALALGIGATTAIFSVVNAVLLRSLPFNEPERLVRVFEKHVPRNRETNVLNPGNFLDWQRQNTSFEQLAGFTDWQVNLTGTDSPEQLQVQYVTGNFFSVIDTPAMLGRTIGEDEARWGNDRFAVISYGLWQNRYGGDGGIIERPIQLNGQEHVVIGVMPPDFYFQNKETDIWVSFSFEPGRDFRKSTGRYMNAVARLRPGVSVEQAKADMETVAARLAEAYPDFNKGWSANVVALHEQVVGNVRPLFAVLLGAVIFVLLIACANVANLLMTRAATRNREMAVRAALGASRKRLVRQVLTESILLGALGGMIGLGLAYWGVDLLVALSPQNLPRMDEVGIQSDVLMFTLAVTLLTGIIFGLIPALQGSKPDLNESLKEGGRGGAGSARAGRARNAFVVFEVALALVLLVGAGLMINSFIRLQNVDPGFNPQNLLSMRLTLPNSKYREPERKVLFFKQVQEGIASIPGVQAVGGIQFTPLMPAKSATSMHIEGTPILQAGEKPGTDVRIITPSYFSTMGIRLIDGRLFDERDTRLSPRVMIVNQAFARKYFPGENALGKRVTIDWDREPAPDEIIGIVADTKDQSMEAEPSPAIYWPHARQSDTGFMTFFVRTNDDPMRFMAAVEGEIRKIDPDQPVAEFRSMDEIVSASVARQRFNMLLMGIFAGVALVLAAVGIYGVMSYSVAQRTHEIGIRMALGASSSDVLGMVLRQGMTLAAIGIIVGLATALALTYQLKVMLSALLFNVATTDPLTFTVIPLLLACVAFMACFIPARRATRTDPMNALRCE